MNIDDILENATNVAVLLDEQELAHIGTEVCEEFEEDKKSRQKWDENNRQAMKLALQVVEPKNTPFEGAANVKYPLLTTAALQFSSRAYPALIPGTNIVKGRVVGYDPDGSKQDRAERIGKHMSYQLIEEMDSWEEEMDKMLLALPILGCLFKKTYYDPIEKRNVSEIVYPQSLVINYYSSTLEKSPRVTHTLYLTENEIYERKAAGLYLDVELEKGEYDPEESEKDRGIDTPEEQDETTPYNILEQHCFMDLDEDGYAEPYIVTVDYESEQVLRIVPRFTSESLEYEEEILLRINPIQYFTKYGFIPSPDGSIYDLGFGTLLSPLNKTINTLINQLLDSGTINNMGGGFIAKGVRVQGGDYKFSPGEWKRVESYGDDLRKGLVPLPTKEPSNVLFTLLNTMVSSGERLSSVTEMMSGEIPGQNTKATVALAAIEQGMKVFNAIYKRIYRSMRKEFKKLYILNRDNLDENVYFTILDPGQERMSRITKSDYETDDADVIPFADPSIATEEQKLAKLTALQELLQLGTINPMEFTKRMLEATDQPNIPALLDMPQPQPDPTVMLEIEKFKDESQRAWAEIQLKAMEVQQKIDTTAITNIINVATAHVKTIETAMKEKSGVSKEGETRSTGNS